MTNGTTRGARQPSARSANVKMMTRWRSCRMPCWAGSSWKSRAWTPWRRASSRERSRGISLWRASSMHFEATGQTTRYASEMEMQSMWRPFKTKMKTHPLTRMRHCSEEMTPEEISWYQEAKADEYKAYAQFQQAKRTLKEARARQHEVKLARKYYKVSSTSSSLGGKTFSGSRPVKGPCFKCGAMAKREERAQLVSGAEELAEYTTYFTVDDEPVHDQEGTIKDNHEWQLR